MRKLFMILSLAVIAISACKKESTIVQEKIVVQHDTIYNGQTITVHDTIIINDEPTYNTTGEWRYFRREFSENGGTWQVEFTNDDKWKFTANKVFVDADRNNIYEKEGFFANYNSYIVIYFFDESTARRYDVEVNADVIILSRIIGTTEEKLYFQKV